VLAKYVEFFTQSLLTPLFPQEFGACPHSFQITDQHIAIQHEMAAPPVAPKLMHELNRAPAF